MRTRVALALALLLGLAIAGCKDSPGPAPTSTSTTATTAPPYQVDGQAVYDWVEGVVTRPDGSPHYRVPGTTDHTDAARWLAEQMQVDGWTVHWQNFTGADYAGLDKGPVAVYHDHPAYCDAAERERLGDLAFSNLMASKPGGSARTFLLGAHWDSKRFATEDPDPAARGEPVLGANDGASGVGVLLQLLHELADDELGFGVQVVLFDGEDGFEDCHPLAGSLWYVHAWEEAQSLAGASAPLPMGGGRVRLLLLDMVGDPEARFIREDRSVDCDRGLVDLLHDKAGRHGLEENFPGTSAPVHDDHTPFAEAGIPAVDLIDFGRGQGGGAGFPPYWHTTHDTMENLSPEMLGNVASLVLDVLQDPSLNGPWPSGC
jgi:hypothetical protein